MSLRPPVLSIPLLLIISAAVLSGCQQTAWKAGAGAGDLERDEAACRAQTPADAAAVRRCLRGKGWTITDFTAPATAETAPLAAGRHATASSPATAPAAASSSAASAAPAPSDPLRRQSVQSWWKAGAQAADFNADANACLAQLGPQHAPDYPRHRYTQAMVKCLRARGWHAGGTPVYTPLR